MYDYAICLSIELAYTSIRVIDSDDVSFATVGDGSFFGQPKLGGVLLVLRRLIPEMGWP